MGALSERYILPLYVCTTLIRFLGLGLDVVFGVSDPLKILQQY